MDVSIQVTTTGADGSATGTTTSAPLRGVLWGLYVAYAAGLAGVTTTDVNITTTVGGNSVTLLTLSNTVTGGFYLLREATVGNTGAADGNTAPWAFAGQTCTVTVAQSNAVTNAVTVTLVLRDL